MNTWGPFRRLGRLKLFSWKYQDICLCTDGVKTMVSKTTGTLPWLFSLPHTHIRINKFINKPVSPKNALDDAVRTINSVKFYTYGCCHTMECGEDISVAQQSVCLKEKLLYSCQSWKQSWRLVFMEQSFHSRRKTDCQANNWSAWVLTRHFLKNESREPVASRKTTGGILCQW